MKRGPVYLGGKTGRWGGGKPLQTITGVELGGKIMDEVSIADQVYRYLKRLRRTLPFPVANEPAYFGLMPAAVKQWYDSGMFSPDGHPLPGRAGNLFSTMFVSFEQRSAVS